MTKIGEKAFFECGKLKEIVIPAKVKKIGDGAFNYCNELTRLEVAQGNKVYDSPNNCNAIIETATATLVAGTNNSNILETVQRIGSEAFYGCKGMTSVNIPTSVTHIGDHAFFYCTNLRTLTIPSSVTKIDSYAFVGCDSLETVDIANSVKVIGDNAFLHDDYIKMVTIGSGVEEIGTWAFKGLDMVTSIVSKIEDVGNVKMGKDVFDEIDMKACTLYVPRGTASSYKAAPQWRDFKKIVEQ